MSFVYNPPLVPNLNIVHVDDHIIVLDKPAGLLSVPGKHIDHKDCLETRVQAEYPGASTIHRLDMDTSGLLIMARHKAAHRYIGYQFERRFTQKRYIARVAGQMADDEGEVDLPLICDWPNRPKQKVDFDVGKSALTRYRVLERCEGETRIELMPVTGRSHQLRVHMLALGHPIIGDRFYGPIENPKGRLMLHAAEIKIRHPGTEEQAHYQAEVPF